jgi:tRNA(fMet)-specific endonuclease VapC
VVSSYVLDTDTLSLYRWSHPAVSRRVASCPSGGPAITVISAEEQLTGWYTMLRRVRQRDDIAIAYQSLADTIAFLARFPILSFPVPAILRYEGLKAMRLNVGAMDLRIAAIALESGCILVTRNTRDFRRVPGLVIEDWSL